MKRLVYFSVFLVLCFKNIQAQTKTWVGPNNGAWSTPGNWAPSGMPGAADTVIFNSLNICDMDLSPIIASLRATGLGGNIISTGGVRSLTIGNALPSAQVFSIDAGAVLSIATGGGFAISFSTFPTSGASNAQVAGTLNLGLASTWVVNNATFTNLTNTDISGTINVAATHTGALFTNSSAATVRFLNGSNLLWARNGGTVPAVDFQNGSTFNVTGIAGTMLTFNTSANYNGLLIWNCTGQTVSGSSAIILPSTSAAMDSIRIVNTGTGTVRLSTNPAGYTVGHLEVQGGTMELSAPASSSSTGTINTDLKITGGTVYGNATYAFDNLAHYPMTLTVNGNIDITGGTFDLTNRPATLNPGGACIVNAKGHVIQTAGLVTATTAFGSQNQINMSGIALQNLELDIFTGTVSLVISNTSGVSLQSNINLPSALVLFSGYIQLNNFVATVGAGLIFTTAGKVVTNAAGALKVTGLTASTSQLFPIAPSSTTYNPVTLTPSAGAFSPNTYSARVETGFPYPIFIPANAVNRTWTVQAATTPGAAVDVNFSYAPGDGNAGFNYLATVDHGVYLSSVWNINQTGLVPTGTYQVATTVSSFVGGADLPMVIGNLGSILSSLRTADLSAQKQNGNALLSWKLNTTVSIKEITVERSADGRNFISLAAVPAVTTTYTDSHILAGTNYYRIKITGNDGKIMYSSIAAVLNKETGFDIVSLLPNVVSTDMILNVTAASKTKINVAITDVTGRPVAKMIYNLTAGSNQFDVNVAGLAAGMYYVTALTSAGDTKTVRFVKQ